MKRAVFLDRDGTLNRDTAYLNDPAQLELLPGATAGLKALKQAGYLLVCVTNQSGIARGLLTQAQLQAIHRRLAELLKKEGVSLDACYYCPYHPEGTVAPFNRESSCRKPQPGMLLQAARELQIDLTASWMIGDAGRDMEAGRSAGCATLWLTQEKSNLPAPKLAHAVAPDWPQAVETLLRLTAAGVNGKTPPQGLEELRPKPVEEKTETLQPASLEVATPSEAETAVPAAEPQNEISPRAEEAPPDAQEPAPAQELPPVLPIPEPPAIDTQTNPPPVPATTSSLETDNTPTTPNPIPDIPVDNDTLDNDPFKA